MKKTVEIPEPLKKTWDGYRVLKSRSDHFGYKSLLIDGYPDPTDEDRERLSDYHDHHVNLYLESCSVLTPEFRDAYWEDDGSCILKNGIRLQY